jgi:hypothetical protein
VIRRADPLLAIAVADRLLVTAAGRGAGHRGSGSGTGVGAALHTWLISARRRDATRVMGGTAREAGRRMQRAWAGLAQGSGWMICFKVGRGGGGRRR